MKRWAKRIAISIGALVVLATLFGTVTEAVMRARAARRYPAPGRLVDIGGRRIQLDCRGTGSPTVVLDGFGYSGAHTSGHGDYIDLCQNLIEII